MKRALLTLLALCFVGAYAQAQGVEKQSIVYAGMNYQDGWGAIYGSGFSLGLVKVMPYGRFSPSNPEAGELINNLSAGIEIGYFPFSGNKWEAGFLAGLTNIDWLDQQDRPLAAYLTQAAGGIFAYQLTPIIGVVGWAKFRPQLFDVNTQWDTKFTTGFALYGKI